MRNLNTFFHPRSIAVVGASRDPSKLGHVLLKNIIDYGFPGDVWPVNPSGGEILGHAVFPSIRKLPKAPDLVLLSIPSRAVPISLREAARRGACAAVVLASGFGEMGAEGKDLERAVRTSGLRVIGPNCMGVYRLPDRLNGTYFWDLPRREGNLAFISQSGAYGGMLFAELRRRAIGLSTFVSIGNQVDVTHADVMEYLERDCTVDVVALFIEEVRDGRRFLEACRRLTRRKRVVAMKVGRTTAGKRAALSHTGSMAGDFEVCRAVLSEAGAFVARDTAEFFDAVAAFSAYPSGASGGLGIVTISGGPCVAAADSCEEAGVPVPELARKTQARVRRLIPEFGALRNPVDMTPQMDPSKMVACVQVIEKDPAVGALLAINVGLDKPEFADAFCHLRKPVLAFVVDAPQITRRFADTGIPIFDTPERAARARAILGKSGSIPLRRATSGSGMALDENRSRHLLAKAGIPFCQSVRAKSIEATIQAAKHLGYPVVLKSPGAGAHKSDAGGVVLDIRDESALRTEYRRLSTHFGPGVLVQEMLRGSHEVLVGARRDTTFGPVVLFGSGGLWTELLADVSIRVAPVKRQNALAMIRETRAGARLTGQRGTAKGDIKALAAMLVALSRWMMNSPDVLEVDLNPVITGGSRTAAVDALVVNK